MHLSLRRARGSTHLHTNAEALHSEKRVQKRKYVCEHCVRNSWTKWVSTSSPIAQCLILICYAPTTKVHAALLLFLVIIAHPLSYIHTITESYIAALHGLEDLRAHRQQRIRDAESMMLTSTTVASIIFFYPQLSHGKYF